jgi:hypothetical protein
MNVMANLLLVIQQTAPAPEMTTGGWIFMIGAWTAIISLAIFCFSRVLRNGKRK